MGSGPKPRQSLTTLQAGRAVAASAVVLYHLNIAFFNTPAFFPEPFFSPFSMGYAGVEFFFVLSGFIILLVHQRDVGRPGTLKPFLIKRFRRVYPPLWVVLTGLVILYAVLPWGESADRDLLSVLQAFALTPARAEPLLGVAWTLRHEVMFYAFFAVLLISRRVGGALMIVWFAGCCVSLMLSGPGGPERFPLSFVLSPYNLLFLGGMVAARRYAAEATSRPLLILAVGLLLFFATGAQDIYAADPLPIGLRTLAYGVGATLIVLGLAETERGGLTAPGWLTYLGDASYALYLVHIPVLSVAVRLLFASGLAETLPRWASFFGLFATALLAGVVFHALVERLLLRRLWAHLDRRRADRPRAEAASADPASASSS